MALRRAALLVLLFGILFVHPAEPAKAGTSDAARSFRLVTADGEVVAEFTLVEGDTVLVELENGVPQVRGVATAGGPGVQITPGDAALQGSKVERAKALLQKKEYDAVIGLLSDDAFRNPGDFEVNLLLARAQVEKCELQKESGDSSYRMSLQGIYQRGQRLYIMNRAHPEPYYIVAKSLYLNNRASKAYDVVRKAVYYAPHDPHYQLLYGDLSVEQAETWRDDRDSRGYVTSMYEQALGAYKVALDGFKDDEALQEKIRAKITRVESRSRR